MSARGYTYLPPETLESLKNISLVAKMLAEGAMLGLHRSPYRGFSSEFAEYRKYSPGDSIRYIDWKTYARSDRYYIKCFEEETNLREYVLLDVSSSMGMAGNTAAKAKFNYACYLAAAFLYLACQQKDAFSLASWNDRIETFSECSNSPSHLSACLRALENMTPHGVSDSSPCLERISNLIPKRSLVIVFSDFLDRNNNFLSSLEQLRFKRCEILLFQVLTREELLFPYRGLIRFEDMETQEKLELEADACREWYLEKLKNYNSSLKDFCDARKIVYETLSTATPFERALEAYFTKREGMF